MDHQTPSDAEPVDDVQGDRGDPVEVTVEEASDASELTPTEEAALRRVDALANLLDEAVRVPGTNIRFGIDPVLGIVPGAGDSVAAALSLYPIAEAIRLDAPNGTIAKMLGLVAVDFAVGSVPLFGTLFDAFWKANVWNARALERHVEGN